MDFRGLDYLPPAVLSPAAVLLPAAALSCACHYSFCLRGFCLPAVLGLDIWLPPLTWIGSAVCRFCVLGFCLAANGFGLNMVLPPHTYEHFLFCYIRLRIT